MESVCYTSTCQNKAGVVTPISKWTSEQEILQKIRGMSHDDTGVNFPRKENILTTEVPNTGSKN